MAFDDLTVHEIDRPIGLANSADNLQFVEERAGANGPYEVTQLINSFLGALAHPWERYKDDLTTMSLVMAHDAGWPAIVKDRPTDRDPESLGCLVRLVRNALAHGNIEFLPSASADIRALRLWNTDRGRITWGAIVTVTDMQSFLKSFVALAEELHWQHVKSRPEIA
jgi:HEPN pEK499 p136